LYIGAIDKLSSSHFAISAYIDFIRTANTTEMQNISLYNGIQQKLATLLSPTQQKLLISY